MTTTTTIEDNAMSLTQQQIEIFQGYRGDRRCFTCEWFRHLACDCRNKELMEARRTQEEESKNRWEALRSCVMSCGVEYVACPIKGDVR